MSAAVRFGQVVCAECNFKARGKDRCFVCGTPWVEPESHPALRHAEAQRQAARRAR